MRWYALINVIFLSLSLVLSSTYSLVAHAQVLVDPNAPKQQRPTVLVAPNGTPLVNIQTPSAAGVSRNTYKQFDVNKKGLILNNSRNTVQSQLGGWVEANPWLNQKEARVILNEVNSNHPSYLNGFIEVAGKRAEVIVANPSGISVNGGGFINANNVTLTTGQYSQKDSELNNLIVSGGIISIEGNGLNTQTADYTKILAKAVDVNAGIWAEELYVGVGEAEYNTTSGSFSQTSNLVGTTSTQPQFLLDVSQLGGMYAGKIKLVGTQAGVGVNNLGYIGATSGDLELTVDGKLTNKGQISAASGSNNALAYNVNIVSTEINNDGGIIHASNNVNINSKNSISNINSGLVSAEKTLEIHAKNNINTDKESAYFASDIQLKADQNINSSGYHIAENGLVLAAEGINLSDGKVSAQRFDLVSARKDAKLSNAQIEAHHLDISTPSTLHTDGAAIAANTIVLDAQKLNNQAGSIEQRSNEALTLSFNDGLNNTQGSIVAAGDLLLDGQFINNTQGQLVTENSLNLTSQTQFINDKGVVLAANDLTLRANELSNQQGTLKSELANISAVIADTITNTGNIYAGESINLQAITLESEGNISAQDSINLQATALNNTGNAYAHNHINVQATTFENTGKILAETGDLTANINQTINNTNSLAAGTNINLSANSITLAEGSSLVAGLEQQHNQGNILLKSQQDLTVNGELTAHNNINTEAVNISLQNGLEAYANNIVLQVTKDLTIEASTDQQAQVVAYQQLSAQAKAIQNAGLLISGQETQITATTSINNSGDIQSEGNIQLNAKDLTNQQNASILAEGNNTLIIQNTIQNSGDIAALDALQLETNSLTNLKEGIIQSEGHAQVDATNNLTNAGQFNFFSTADLQAATITNQANAKIISNGALQLTSLGALNNLGEIYSQTQAQLTSKQLNNAKDAKLVANDLTISNDNTANSGFIEAENSLVLNTTYLTNNLDAHIVSANRSRLDVKQTLTNYGLLDGKINHIVTNALNNMSTGRIYGNHLAIEAKRLENKSETKTVGDKQTVISGTLAARERMDLGVETLINESDALILSGGDLNIAGGLDKNLNATGRSTSIKNISGTIESNGNMSLFTIDLSNENPTFDFKKGEKTTEILTLIQKSGDDTKHNLNDLKEEKYSETYQYRIPGVTPEAYGTIDDINKKPLPLYRECKAERASEEDCGDKESGYIEGSDYTSDHKIWEIFLAGKAPRPEPSVSQQPTMPKADPADCEDSTSEACSTYKLALKRYEEDLAQYEKELSQYNAWVDETDELIAELNKEITAYNDANFTQNVIRDFTEYQIERTTTAEVINEDLNKPGKILSGKDLHIDGKGVLTNDKSMIIAGNALTGNIGSINNIGATATYLHEDVGTSQYSESVWHGGFRRYHHRHYKNIIAYNESWEEKIALPVALIDRNANDKLENNYDKDKTKYQNSVAINNQTANNVGGANSIQVVTPNIEHKDLDTDLEIRTKLPNFNIPGASLYIQNPAPDARYLVETDPVFANYKEWLSSDYIFEQLEFDADEYQKRFADGFYEQRLVREQINQLTGQYFLGDYTDEEQQYLELMQAGVKFAEEYNLVPGIALTQEQMAALTSDMVWLTSQEVVLNDGTVQKVLVPQLYALVEINSASGGSATIAARDINLKVQEDVTNSGSLLAKEGLGIQAKNILNDGGRLQAKAVNLKAEEDINNIGGEIYADDSLSLVAKGNITIASTTQQNTNTTENTSIINTIVDRVAGIFIGKKATGDLVIDAGKTLEITGAEIDNASQQTLQLKAQDDIVFGSLELQQQEHLGSGKNYKNYDEVTYQGTQVNSQGGLTLQAGNHVNLTSAQLNSASDIEINAKNINITAQVDSKLLDQQSYTKTSSRKITEKNGFIEQSASNSSLNGENIKLNATGTVAITGSQLQANNDLTVGEVKMVQQADGSLKAVSGDSSPDNLIVNTLELTNETWHERSVEKRGLAKTLTQVAAVAGTLIFPTLAPGLETPTMSLGESSSQHTISTTHQGSELNAGNNVILAAKNSAHMTSGEINAGNTAMIAAKDVTFDVAVDTHITETSHKESTVKGLGASLSKDELTLGGMEKTKQTDTERTTTTTHQGTQINTGNLVVMADNDASFIASDVNVQNDAIVQAGNNLSIEGRADSTTTDTYSKTDTTTVTAGVKNAYVDTALAADALVKAGEDVKRAERALRDAEQRVKDGTLAPSALDDYKINLAAASTQLTQATLNLAASGATAAASTGTLGFYATGKAEKTTTEQHSTTTEQSYQGSNFNVGGNASFEAGNLLNIVGSGITVQETLALNADHVNIRAGEEHSSSASSERTKSAGGSVSTGAGGSLSANASQSKYDSESQTLTHANSQISAGNLNSDSQSFTLAGANVEIQNDINLNTQQLTVESVQDTHHSTSKGSSQSVGATAGGGSINPSSAGFGQNSSSEDSQWVNNQTTFIGGGNVNITADKTTVTGAVVANATRNNDGSLTDHGNLNLITDELVINDLQDYNRNESKGIDVSAGLSKNGTSSVGLQKGGHNTEQTTYATLGGGTVTKKDGTAHNTENVNRDLNNTQEITLDQQTAGLDATVTVDHRLLSEGGRKAIKKDVIDSVQHGHEIVQSVKDVASTDQDITDFFGNVHSYATERKVLAEQAANQDQQDKLRGDQQAEGSQQGLQNLSDALTKAQGLEQGAQVALYDGSQLQDNTLVFDHTSVNKTQVEGAYHQNGNGIYVNIDQTDMTNSTNTVSTLVHEQTRHRLAQEGQTGSLSRDDQTTLATNHGDRAGDVWNAYSGLAGISTQGGSTQTQWNSANSQSAPVQQGTNAIAQINNNDLKARQLNRNEASLLDQAKANINGKSSLSAEQKNQAIVDLNALACAAVQCAAGVSTNDPLYDQVSQLQAQGEALKNQGEDVVSTLSAHGVEVKAADNDFAYGKVDYLDDFITSNEQTVARAGQVTQGIAGAAEAAGGVALSGTGLGAIVGVPLAGLGAYDMADASDKLGTPHTYQSGQNVLNSFSLDTHGGDISPTKDAAIDLGINAALTVGAAKVAKHADDIANYVGGVFKKGDVELPKNGSHVGSNGSYNAEGDFDGQIPSEIKAIQQAQDADRQLAQQNNWLDANGNTWWPDNTKGYDKVPGSEKPAQHYQGEEISRYVEGNPNNYDPKMDTGRYTSPSYVSEEARAMPGSSGKTEHIFVIKNPNMETKKSNAAPYFEKEGLGVQYEHKNQIKDLIDNKDIEYLGVRK